MKYKLIHPLWTHLAAAAALLWLIIRLIGALPLPRSAPIHFSWPGVPNAVGTPWMVFGITLALCLLYIAISIFLDELWARQETRKRFNWLSLFDDIIVGFIAGISAGYLDFLSGLNPVFPFPWQQTLLITGMAFAAAVVFELLRPYRVWEKTISAEDTTKLEAQLKQKLSSSTPVLFWQSQNPGYITLLTIALPVILTIGAISLLDTSLWVAVMLFVVGLMLTLIYGGQRTLVTQQAVSVRFGLLGLRLLNLSMPEIIRIEGHSFSPLKDFGGYGIRFNREMKAFFMRGNRGVKLTGSDGKVFLIGSDHPDQLETAIKTIHNFVTRSYRDPGHSFSFQAEMKITNTNKY